MEQTYRSWKAGDISDSQMAMVYFIHRFAIDNEDKKLKKLIRDIPYEQILEKYQFKKIKGKAITCLQKWISGEWNLTLSERIFTPYEVLNFQARGIRPVTMRFNDTTSPVMHRKNSLDFFVHDLEHGYMFFHDEYLKQMQKTFFHRIESSLETDLWKNRLQDKEFREKFYYMISDMNSHREHYKAYLRSILPVGVFSQYEFLFE